MFRSLWRRLNHRRPIGLHAAVSSLDCAISATLASDCKALGSTLRRLIARPGRLTPGPSRIPLLCPPMPRPPSQKQPLAALFDDALAPAPASPLQSHSEPA